MLSLVAVCPAEVSAQVPARDAEAGLPFATRFAPEAYGSSLSVQAVAEDARGVLYAGTPDGILEYDGAAWALIRVSGGVRSLAVDGAGRVWYGAADELGYLAPDRVGRMTAVSLHGVVPEPYRQGLVWSAVAASGRVFFVSDAAVLRWATDRMEAWPAETAFGQVTGGDALCVIDAGRGLLRMESRGGRDVLEPVPGGERFAQADVTLLLVDGDRQLVGVRGEGLVVVEGGAVTPLQTAAYALLGDGQSVTSGAVLSGGRIALGTSSAGLVVINESGAAEVHLGEGTVVEGQQVHHVAATDRGDLWLALDDHIALVELDSPFSWYEAVNGAPVKAYGLARHGGRLFAILSSGGGVRYLDPEQKSFRRVPGAMESYWALEVVGGDLLAAGQDGLDRVEADGPVVLRVPGVSDAVVARGLSGDSSVALVGTRAGLELIRRAPGQPSGWVGLGKVGEDTGAIAFIAEGPDGALWAVGTSHVLRVEIRATPGGESLRPNDVIVERFTTSDGVPTGYLYLYRVGQAIYVAGGGEQLVRFDPDTRRFLPDDTFAPLLVGDPRAHFTLEEGEDGRVWIGSATGTPAVATPGPDGYTFEWFPRFRHLGVHEIYPGRDGVAWLEGDPLLIRYDSNQEPRAVPVPLVRRVTVGGRLVYGGAGPISDAEVTAWSGAVEFRYAAPAAYPGLRYRTRLDGFDAEWSAWDEDTERTYTNLPPGDFRFLVEAEGRPAPAVVALTVRPPWYLSAWAVAFYVSLALGLVAGLVVGAVRWRTKRLDARRILLEKTVDEQTWNIRRQNARLAGQADQLAAQADDLRRLGEARSRFFANVSHELRTPLALLLGPIRDLRRGRFGVDESAAPLLNRAAANGRRLQRLIDDLLTLTKADAGALGLRRQRLDLGAFVRARVAAFGSRPAAAGVVLSYVPPMRPVEIAADPARIETVVYNLVGNAVTFTPAGGTVTVRVEAGADGSGRIVVADTGIGIAERDLGSLFERFYQADTAQSRVGQGAGIGLALVHEIVQLHGGTVAAESALGEGTTITVDLPTGTVDTAEGLPDPGEAPALALPAGDGARAGVPDVAPSDGDVVVLVIEDNADLRAYLRTLLDDAYTVVEAADGAAGVSAALDLVPDLVISDVMMPVLDGFAVLAALKGDIRTSHVPVALLTARADAESRLAGLASGADAYLAKPFDGAELEATVQNLLANRDRLRAAWGQHAPTPHGDGHPAAEPVAPGEAAFLGRVQVAIADRLADPAFGVGALADVLGLSPRQLRRKLKALTGETPGALVRRARVERAAELLASGEASVKEAAYRVGFASENGFRDAFQAQLGVLPSEYDGDAA